MSVLETIDGASFADSYAEATRRRAMEALEAGRVLFFPQLAFRLEADELQFLDPKCSDGRAKNVSFDARAGVLRGTHLVGEERERLQAMVARFAKDAERLFKELLPNYSSAVRLGRTSYRPVEIKERVSSYRKDDSRLHVDAFPSRPNGGERILRLFTNINPKGQGRIWRLGEPFEICAARFLPRLPRPLPGKSQLLRAVGLTHGHRSAYDHYMLALHDAMKGDVQYQRQCPQYEVTFPAATSWMVFTDQVSHAAMAGQYVFEQTFHVPVQSLRDPATAPLRVLERLLNRTLASTRSAA